MAKRSPAPQAAVVQPAPAVIDPAPSAPSARSTESVGPADAEFGYRGAIARKEMDEKAQREARAGKLEANVADIERRPRGELVVTLDNGQVWTQKTAESARIKVGDRVEIKKASFGSFLMVLPNNRAIRVTREK